MKGLNQLVSATTNVHDRNPLQAEVFLQLSILARFLKLKKQTIAILAFRFFRKTSEPPSNRSSFTQFRFSFILFCTDSVRRAKCSRSPLDVPEIFCTSNWDNFCVTQLCVTGKFS